MDVVFLRGAEADLLEAYILFDEKGRGAAFDASVESAISKLQAFPESGPLVFGDFRRVLLSGFPYGVFYRKHSSRLFVVAVLDLRQNPERIVDRLR